MADQSIPPSDNENRLLAITREFLESSENPRALTSIDINSSLEKDLGIDSLGRVELFHRIEKAFGLQLPDSLMGEANTLKDVLSGIDQAHPPQRRNVKSIQPIIQKTQIDPTHCKTLVEVLKLYASKEPERPHIYLQDEEGKEETISYGLLFSKASAIARGLISRGIKQGETIAIMLPTSNAFFYSFFGILLAGGIPVPIYPPFRADQIEEYAKREASILRNAEVRILITFQRVETLGKLLKTFIPSLIAVVTLAELSQSTGELPEIMINPEDSALIQYTSGSTGLPKGVLLSHANLIANIRACAEAIQVSPKDVFVSWLPLYHDMGLIGTWLGSLFFGIPLVIMSPLTFLSHPERWLWAIHYHRGTISAAPNFAYELCLRKIDDYRIEGLDLSSWRLAFNGAEGVHAKTLAGFVAKFAPYGFNPKTLYPVYGLAENTVGLTFPPLGEGYKVDRIERNIFETKQHAVPAKEGEKNFLEFVACGKPIPRHAIRIVNSQGMAIGERVVGEIEFIGPSSMQGYYRNPQATQAVFNDGWWKTGDLAYQADGEIYITGRKKDLIIKAGRNIYPDEIEEITAKVNGVRKGCVVTFGVHDPHSGTEKLVIVAEAKQFSPKNNDRIRNEIIEAVTETTGIPPDHVVLVRPKVIPKTSSGKLRRSATKEAYLKGQLSRHGLPTWLQLSKLFIKGKFFQLGKFLKNFLRLCYGGYVFLLMGITLLPVWLGLFILPRKLAAKFTHHWAHLFLWLVGCPIHQEGRENLQHHGPMIYVANHTSYLDTLVLLAVLPSNILFVGKQELLKTKLIRTFINRLGHLTVDRMDFGKSIADTHIILQRLHEGHSIAIFPEGTFTYATGLRPFKSGAFKLAAETNTPICPVALNGTRHILRSGSALPTPGKITITYVEPLQPQGNDWQEVMRLRAKARIEIAKYCGEFPIDLIAAGPIE